MQLEAPEVANKVWELHRLAELKPAEEAWKTSAATALKEMLGMVDRSEAPINDKTVQALENASRRLDAAQRGVDPTIYPFHRRR